MPTHSNYLNCLNWKNNNSEKIKIISKRWAKNNNGKKNFYYAIRRAAKLKATPMWANLSKIKEIYIRNLYSFD